MNATVYNVFGTKENRVVASFDVDTGSVTEALDFAQYHSNLWNKDETRENMPSEFRRRWRKD